MLLADHFGVVDLFILLAVGVALLVCGLVVIIVLGAVVTLVDRDKDEDAREEREQKERDLITNLYGRVVLTLFFGAPLVCGIWMIVAGFISDSGWLILGGLGVAISPWVIIRITHGFDFLH